MKQTPKIIVGALNLAYRMGYIDRDDEIVRCKDCKYWQDNNGGYPHDDCKWNADETPDPDDYCSGAERKEE